MGTCCGDQIPRNTVRNMTIGTQIRNKRYGVARRGRRGEEKGGWRGGQGERVGKIERRTRRRMRNKGRNANNNNNTRIMTKRGRGAGAEGGREEMLQAEDTMTN